MSARTKILYVVTQSDWGGAQRYIFDLASGLSSDQFETAVAAGGSGDLFSKCESVDIPVIRLKKLVRPIHPIKDILAVAELRRLFKTLRPDVVHLNSSKAGVTGALAARMAKVPKVVYTAHGFVFNEPMPGWKKQMYERAERMSAKFKDYIICVSEFDRQVGIRHRIAPPEKLVTIHNGVRDINFQTRSQARSTLRISERKFVVGTIANFYPTKGLEFLIEAAKLVAGQVKDVEFVIIGNGPLRPQLEKKIRRMGLEQIVKLPGSLSEIGSNFDPAALLPAFDVFVLPSVKEGLPYSILEAQLAGVPVVATQVGGVPEIIQSQATGLLAPPGLPAPLSNLIITLQQDPKLRQTLAEQGRQRVRQEFLLPQMLSATTKLYAR